MTSYNHEPPAKTTSTPQGRSLGRKLRTSVANVAKVMAVLGLLFIVMAIALMFVGGWVIRDIRIKARLEGDRQSVGAVREAIARYHREHGRYPRIPAGATQSRMVFACSNFRTVYDSATGRLRITSSNTVADCPTTPQKEEAALHWSRGDERLSLNRLSEAIAEFDQAISRDPRLARAYYGRGVALSRSGAWERALADLEKAIALDPEEIEAYEALAWVLTGRGEWDRIIERWNRFIELQPEIGRAYFGRGGAYFRKGEMALALRDAEEACRLGYEKGCRTYGAYKRQGR